MKRKQNKAGLCPEGMDLLLPWYVNRTLEKREKDEVTRHLPGCAVCRQELEHVKKEQGLYRSTTDAIPVPQTFPSLIAEIEQRGTGRRGIWQRIAALVPRPQPALAAALIGIQFLVIVGLVGLLALNPWDAGESLYRTLSGPVGVEENGPRLAIIFRDGVREKAMREVILEIEGTIVSGPTELGIYTVELRSEMRSEELQHLITSLRQKKDTIRFVEVRGE